MPLLRSLKWFGLRGYKDVAPDGAGWPARGTASRSRSGRDFFSTKFLTGAKSKFVKQKTTFKIGELVELKSGSPKMTVTEIIAQGKVRCSWFVGNKHYKTVFPPKSLQLPAEDRKAAITHEALKKVIGFTDAIEKPAKVDDRSTA